MESERKFNGPFSPPAALYYLFAIFMWFGLPMFAPRMTGVDWITWFFSAGCLILLVAPVAFIKGYDLFQPLSFVTLSAAIGIPLRTIFIFSSNDPAVRDKMLRDQTTPFFLAPTVLMFVAIVMLMAGYFLKPGATRVRQIARVFERLNRPIGTLRMILVIALLCAISTVGLIIFVRVLGLAGIDFSNLSAKRLIKVEGSTETTSMSYLRLMMRMSTLGFLLAFTWFTFSRKPMLSFTGLLVGLLGVFAAFPPFFTSNRSDVIFIPLIALAVWNYGRAQVTPRKLGGFVLAGIAVLGFMGALRSTREENIGAAVAETLSSDVYESIVDNYNFLSMPTTAHVMAAMPDKLPYAYGSTLFLWVIAPIPKVLWPDKPAIAAGRQITDTVFDNVAARRGGTPPNIVTDLYWNFGIFGVVIGMFGFGCILRFLYYNALPYLGQSPGALLLYLLAVFPFTHFTATGNVSQGIIQALYGTLPMLVLLPLVLRRRPIKRTPAQPPS